MFAECWGRLELIAKLHAVHYYFVFILNLRTGDIVSGLYVAFPTGVKILFARQVDEVDDSQGLDDHVRCRRFDQW